MMTQFHDNSIDRMLGDFCQDQVPEDVTRQLHSHLANFRQKLGSVEHAPRRQQLRRPMFFWGGALTGVTSLLVVAVSIWFLRSQVTFADVIAAAREQPWLHVTINEADGTEREVWYSQEKDISAWRNADWIEYHDHQLRVYESYDVKEKILYRVPEYLPRRMNYYRMMATSLPVLLKDNEPKNESLDEMDFLGKYRAQMKVSHQKLEATHEDGREWLNYRLELRHPELPDSLQLLIRVDAVTKLPKFCRAEGRIAMQVEFDYSDQGPANVYELGVPEDTKLVNRIPGDDIKRINKTLAVGRTRMDSYRAIVVERSLSTDYEWWNDMPMILYRKGDKFRADNARWRGDFPRTNKPAEDADMRAWWKRRVEDFTYSPTSIVRGLTTYSIKIAARRDTRDKTLLEVKSVERRDTNSKLEDMFPPYYSRRPEFVCRPGLGIGSQQMEPLLELHPDSGPDNCVLLHVKRTGSMPEAPGAVPDHVTIPDAYRFWLNPVRDYAVERWDMLGDGEAGEEEIVTSFLIEEMAKSPNGVWYATKFRDTAKGPNGETIGQQYFLYVDFEVDLPDSFFEPPKVGHRY